MSSPTLTNHDASAPTRIWPDENDPLPQDWWGWFHVHAFLSLILADRNVERRELVWIKRFFLRHKRPALYTTLQELVEAGESHAARAFEHLVALAATRMSPTEKRHFIYNLAQMCKAKGTISTEEYESILHLAENLGVEDTDADAIINSVFSINDTFVAILGVLALGVILYTTRVVIVPLVIAIFITMLINRVDGLVATALSLRRGRWLSKMTTMALVMLLMFAIIMTAIHSGKQIAARLPFYEARVMAALQQTESLAEQYGFAGINRAGLLEQIQQIPIGRSISQFLSSLVDLVGNFVLVLIFTGFLVFSNASYGGIVQEMNEKITAYVSIKTLAGLITALAVFLLCWAFGIDFALFWAILSFLLNYIPTIGSIVSTLPPILLSTLQLDSWPTIVAFALLAVLVQVLLGNVLEPKLMGSRLALNPVAILLGLIFWGFLWGLPGMFLAAPLMALLRILSSYFNFSRDFEQLLAAD